MNVTNEILDYVSAHKQEAYDLLITLAQIPAPSNHEEKRAEFCCQWLKEQGAQGVYIDEVLNVVYPINCDGDKPIVVISAHSDVVFPDTTPLPLHVEDGKIFCPGVGDDTINVVALLMTAKFITQQKLQTGDCGVMLVVNSGEEGLGDLKGTRYLFKKFGSRVREFISLDGGVGKGSNQAVGSRRFRVELLTEGGHSYGAFGNRNAIAYLASMIDELYKIQVPTRGKTTYNVGTISGGTSVNTIAQNAQMLYEFRSSNREDLEEMQGYFDAILAKYRGMGLDISVTLVGERPCSGNIDPVRHKKLMDRASAASQKHCGTGIIYGAGSTDCNIPLSMGIPAINVGGMYKEKIHTREEFVKIDSLHPGLNFTFDLILHYFQ